MRDDRMDGMKGEVIKVSGPLVVARGLSGARMFEMVRVGELGLFGEIIEIKGEEYSIQTYEETEGIGPGQPVVRTGEPLSVELGPGLIRSIYDGIQRPLDVLAQDFGEYIVRGTQRPALDRSRKWDFVPLARVGDVVKGGDILGAVQESALVSHKIMVPPGKSGTVGRIAPVTGNVDTEVAVIQSPEGPFGVTMVQRWPVRDPRPTKRKVPHSDHDDGAAHHRHVLPHNEGRHRVRPGPFGSGKTVVQHQLAKWADAQIVVYVGCGERGNEMTDVLMEFPHLKDPETGEPLMERTVLIANTSNMPVAAREASVFTGIASPSTSATWDTPSPSWPIPRAAGPRPCARYRAASRRCPGKKATPPTSGRASPVFTNGRARSSA
jgi:V/A-type H+-transporting ATPase subunit A